MQLTWCVARWVEGQCCLFCVCHQLPRFDSQFTYWIFLSVFFPSHSREYSHWIGICDAMAASLSNKSISFFEFAIVYSFKCFFLRWLTLFPFCVLVCTVQPPVRLSVCFCAVRMYFCMLAIYLPVVCATCPFAAHPVQDHRATDISLHQVSLQTTDERDHPAAFAGNQRKGISCLWLPGKSCCPRAITVFLSPVIDVTTAGQFTVAGCSSWLKMLSRF